MDFTKLIICVAMAILLLSDVVCSRPTGEEQGSSDLMSIVRHIDDNLVRHTGRRRRRHLRTQQIALMEFCLQKPHMCRHNLEQIRRNDNRRVTVLVIEK
ncbi:hypothetical protein MAR_013112 [Mya arenaria]|uniref:Uncharacterized protein n=1 Tax=Mya arenaria TaxID=6604 RepID=A0ABY7FYX7_MYAAR|nr:hypothetical protein MAR_013112 [Mya arenaria]